MDIVTYALLKKQMGSATSSVMKEEIVINENGEVEVITQLPSLMIDFNTGCLTTDSDVFSINSGGFLVSEV